MRIETLYRYPVKGLSPERVKEQIGRLKTALAEQQKWAESYQGFRI